MQNIGQISPVTKNMIKEQRIENIDKYEAVCKQTLNILLTEPYAPREYLSWRTHVKLSEKLKSVKSGKLAVWGQAPASQEILTEAEWNALGEKIIVKDNSAFAQPVLADSCDGKIILLYSGEQLANRRFYSDIAEFPFQAYTPGKLVSRIFEDFVFTKQCPIAYSPEAKALYYDGDTLTIGADNVPATPKNEAAIAPEVALNWLGLISNDPYWAARVFMPEAKLKPDDADNGWANRFANAARALDTLFTKLMSHPYPQN